MCRPSRTREQDTKQFQIDVRLPYSLVSNAPRKSTTNYKLDPTDYKGDIQTHPVESVVDTRKSICSILPIKIGLRKNWLEIENFLKARICKLGVIIDTFVSCSIVGQVFKQTKTPGGIFGENSYM